MTILNIFLLLKFAKFTVDYFLEITYHYFIHVPIIHDIHIIASDSDKQEMARVLPQVIMWQFSIISSCTCHNNSIGNLIIHFNTHLICL